MMEGSYYILLSYILLTYSTAKIPDRRKIQRTFLKHTHSYRTMAYPFPESSFLQEPHLDPARVSNYASARSYLPQQGHPSTLNSSDLSSFITLNNSNLDNLHAAGAIGLNDELTAYFLSIENLRGPNPSNLSVSHAPVTTDSYIPDHPGPDMTAYSGVDPHCNHIYQPFSNSIPFNDVSIRDDDSWRKQLGAEAHGLFLEPQELALGRKLSTNATPFSGLGPQGFSNPKDLTSSIGNFSNENVYHTAHPHQFSCNISNCNSLEPPKISASSRISTLDNLSPKTNLNCLGPSGISTTSYVSAQRRLAPKMTNTNGLGPPNISSHSCTSTPRYLAPNMGSSKHLKPSGVATSSHSSTTRRRAPNVTKYNNLGTLGKSTAVQIAHTISKSNNFEPYGVLPSHRLAPKVDNSSSVDPSDTSTPYHLFSNITNLEGPEASGVATPYAFPSETINPKSPEPSNISVKDEVDLDDVITYFTTLNDDSQQPSEHCDIDDVDAHNTPEVSHSHVPDDLEPHPEQCCEGQAVRDTGSVELLQPRRKYQRRNESNVLPAGLEPRQKEKVTRSFISKGVRKNASTSARRHDPKNRYFCADPTCQVSQGKNYKGFPTHEDMERHLRTHEDPKYLCTLPHPPGCQDAFRRLDGLTQ